MCLHKYAYVAEREENILHMNKTYNVKRRNGAIRLIKTKKQYKQKLNHYYSIHKGRARRNRPVNH